jgi:hypothetical protein
MQTTLAALCCAGFSLVGAKEAGAVARFGTYCQQDFQSNWQNNLGVAWDLCAWFNDELDDTDTKVFYWNTHGAKPYYEQSLDQVYVEQVNLFFSVTHGGISASSGQIYMWDQNQTAETSLMRLGDEGWGTAIMSNYSCHLLYRGDNNLWTRWNAAFKGGLKYATGSHDIIWFGTTTNEVGEDYADNLQSSQAIKFAWRDGLSDWNVDQDIAVASFGSTEADCANRRDTMKWQNYVSGYPVIRDGQVQWWCQTQWTDY